MDATEMTDVPGIVKTPDVCGGRPRIDGHRLTVDLMVRWRRLGVSDLALRTEYYPQLTAEKLAGCWEYYRRHTNEIDRHIWDQRDADVPEGEQPAPGVVIAGLRLGLTEDEVRAAFDPPLTPADIDAAWVAYWANPTRIDLAVAELVRAG